MVLERVPQIISRATDYEGRNTGQPKTEEYTEKGGREGERYARPFPRQSVTSPFDANNQPTRREARSSSRSDCSTSKGSSRLGHRAERPKAAIPLPRTGSPVHLGPTSLRTSSKKITKLTFPPSSTNVPSFSIHLRKERGEVAPGLLRDSLYTSKRARKWLQAIRVKSERSVTSSVVRPCALASSFATRTKYRSSPPCSFGLVPKCRFSNKQSRGKGRRG